MPSPKLEETPETKAGKKKASNALGRGVIKGMTLIETNLVLALNKAMESSVWTGFNPKYPYPRKSGQVMGSSARNIVDTGALQKSLKMNTSYKKTLSTLSIIYDSPYANITYYGGVIVPYGDPKNNAVTIPGRPWVEAVLQGTNGITMFPSKKYFLEGLDDAWNSTMT